MLKIFVLGRGPVKRDENAAFPTKVNI